MIALNNISEPQALEVKDADLMAASASFQKSSGHI